MRVLVIGGSGFIGSHVVDALLARGLDVIVLDRERERYRPLPPGVEYIAGELGNRGGLENIVSRGVDYVVHLASSTVPKTSNDDPIFDVHMNLVETIALLELCRDHKVRKIVFFSSGGTVYGVPAALPVTETHATDPLCSYGIVKLAVEKYLQCFHQLYGLQYAALRVSNAYGIRQNPASQQGVIPVFMHRVLHDEPVKIWGDGSVVRDFVAVKDVAALCATALLSDENGVFNAGSGVGVSINRVLEEIAAVTAKQPVIIREPSRSFDVPAIVLDSGKARTTFGWTPRIALTEGLRELAGWLRREGGATSAS